MGPEIALAGLALGTATQAYGAHMAGQEQSRAAAFEKQQYDIQAQQYRTAAARDEATRREELRSSIDTALAYRAGRGVGTFSPTANTIFDSLTEKSRSAMFTAKSSLLTKSDQASMAADMADRRARMAAIGGDLSALSTVSTSLYKYYATPMKY
jgi:hypothetical protein